MDLNIEKKSPKLLGSTKLNINELKSHSTTELGDYQSIKISYNNEIKYEVELIAGDKVEGFYLQNLILSTKDAFCIDDGGNFETINKCITIFAYITKTNDAQNMKPLPININQIQLLDKFLNLEINSFTKLSYPSILMASFANGLNFTKLPNSKEEFLILLGTNVNEELKNKIDDFYKECDTNISSESYSELNELTMNFCYLHKKIVKPENHFIYDAFNLLLNENDQLEENWFYCTQILSSFLINEKDLVSFQSFNREITDFIKDKNLHNDCFLSKLFKGIDKGFKRIIIPIACLFESILMNNNKNFQQSILEAMEPETKKIIEMVKRNSSCTYMDLLNEPESQLFTELKVSKTPQSLKAYLESLQNFKMTHKIKSFYNSIMFCLDKNEIHFEFLNAVLNKSNGKKQKTF